MPNKHRLAAKLEETVLGNGIWNKVTVKIPNPSYILSEVKYENNKLSVLFEYTNTNDNPQNFSFMLSAFGINPNNVSENDEFLAVGVSGNTNQAEKEEAINTFPGWHSYVNQHLDQDQQAQKTIGFTRCPPRCLLSD